MRRVKVEPPSFPAAPANALLEGAAGKLFQVLCGDAGAWRLGLYSPAATRAEDCAELERHTCPELFLLLSGKVSLVLAEGSGLRILALESGRPALITLPHAGFCPDGAHTGTALVVERDTFETEYRSPREWLAAGAGPLQSP